MDGLPSEILRDIFLGTLPCIHSESHIPYSESIASPLRVSHVCQSWRELALSCRELWSHLYINKSHLSRRKQSRVMVEIFDTWLARTNDGPINFAIRCCMPYFATSQDRRCVEHILTKLIENQRRWKDVVISCDDVDFTTQFLGFYLIDMPLLTSLQIWMNRSLRSVLDFSRSTRLRRLRIYNENCRFLTDDGLSHLEDAELTFSFPENYPNPEHGPKVALCLKFLNSAPSLSNFCVSIRSKPSPSSFLLEEEHILHTGLRKLELWDEGGGVLPAMILDSVTLPSLEWFTYGSMIGGENLLRFFQRSMPSLASLTIYQNDISEDSLISILRLLPTLKELELSEIKLSHCFFNGLVVPDGISDDRSAFREQVACPLLSSLHVRHVYEWSSAALQPLLTMAKSRASVLGTFQTARFNGDIGSRAFAVAGIDNYVDTINLKRGFALY